MLLRTKQTPPPNESGTDFRLLNSETGAQTHGSAVLLMCMDPEWFDSIQRSCTAKGLTDECRRSAPRTCTNMGCERTTWGACKSFCWGSVRSVVDQQPTFLWSLIPRTILKGRGNVSFVLAHLHQFQHSLSSQHSAGPSEAQTVSCRGQVRPQTSTSFLPTLNLSPWLIGTDQ